MDKKDYLFNPLTNTETLMNTLNTLLENSYEGIIVIDKDGIITTVNSSFARFLLTKPEEITGKHILEVSPDSKLVNILETGKIEIGELAYLGKNKMIVMRIPIFKDDEIVGAIGKILFRDIKELKSLVKKIDMMENELKYYKGKCNGTQGAKYDFTNIIAVSDKRSEMVQLAKKVSRTDSTVLITGETGTGKELVAHSIHNNSLRRYGPFVRINCAAIPKELLEAELFGYEKGAFTGAKSEGKPGKFSAANGGTIFLDEIGDMPLSMQTKLLRVLQEKEVQPVGANYVLDLDVRVIAATNKNLKEMVTQNKFREDLYYRLNIIALTVPPLRETKKDLIPLTQKIVNEFNDKLNLNIKGVSEEVIETFKRYNWPGNIRELHNVLEIGVNFCEKDVIELKDLPTSFLENFKESCKDVAITREDTEVLCLKDAITLAEIDAIKKALASTKGNKAKAAKILGIHRSSLYQKLTQYHLSF